MDRVLLVDDDPNLLAACRRNMRKRYQLDTASNGQEGLEKLRANGFGLVVADMRMPEMDGVQMLQQAKNLVPNTVRVMLTGNADQQTAVDAVNKGDVFRFLTKPCKIDELVRAIDDGLSHHHLIVAEKELLEKTLNGAICVITEVLSLVNPDAFGRTNRIKRYVNTLVEDLKLQPVWEFEVMAMLSQIGCVILPEQISIENSIKRNPSDEEKQLLEMYPSIGADLLQSIPRMDNVAKSIRYQQKNMDGSGSPYDGIAGEEIPIGARILRAVVEFDAHVDSGANPRQAIMLLKREPNKFDAKIIEALEVATGLTARSNRREVSLADLADGMVLAQDLRTPGGNLIVASGQQITLSVRKRLMLFKKGGQLNDPIIVESK